MNGFGEVPSLKNLSSKAFIQAYDGSEEDREALRSIESHRYDFSDCIIQDKDFSGENLQGANFTNCKLVNVNLSYTNLTDTNFEGASFQEVFIDQITLQPGWVIKDSMSDFQLVYFYSDLANAAEEFKSQNQDQLATNCHKILKGLNDIVFKIKRLNLSHLNLTHINLTKANLNFADLTRANLSGANFTKANLSFVNLGRANLSYADLTEANLEGSNLKSADFSYTTLIDINLRNIIGVPQLNNAILAPGDIFEYDGTVFHLISIYGQITNKRSKKTLMQFILGSFQNPEGLSSSSSRFFQYPFLN